jgi:hypothetical protein
MIHLFVEILDRYFGNVCELDIIFNFHKVKMEGGADRGAKANRPIGSTDWIDRLVGRSTNH